MTFDNLKEQTLEEHVIYQGKIITVKNDKVLLPNNKESFREKICHPGGACVLAIKDEKVLLIKQFRYAYDQVIYEIPAGKLEKGEDPLLAAKRELKEETGYIADQLKPLFTIYPTPGYTDEKLYLYLAKDLKEGECCPDEDEFVTRVWIDKKEAFKMAQEGTINDAKTLIALLWLKADGEEV